MNILRLDFLPLSPNFGLLVLRLWLGLSMLLLHGLGKIDKLKADPVQFLPAFGLDAKTSLMLAVGAEVVGSILLILGLFTRLAALSLIVTMSVAFFVAHNGAFSGEKPGELAFIYLGGYVVLFLTGAGSFSADVRLGRR